MSEKDAAQQEREMREHEREARERELRRALADGDTSTDPDGGAEPAPPGNVQSGGQSG